MADYKDKLDEYKGKLQESESMRKRLRTELIWNHGGHRHGGSVCGICQTLDDDGSLGYWSPGDAAAAEEHAANGDVNVLAERIDMCSEQVAQLHHELREAGVLAMTDAARRGETGGDDPRNEDTLSFQAGRIDACMEAIGDIRRRLDEPGGVEDEARLVASMAATLLAASDFYTDHIRVSNQLDAVGTAMDVLKKARAAVRKERGNG